MKRLKLSLLAFTIGTFSLTSFAQEEKQLQEAVNDIPQHLQAEDISFPYVDVEDFNLQVSWSDEGPILTDFSPRYKLFRDDCTIDKIEYRKDATVVHFRYTGWGTIYLYGRTGAHPWKLITKDGKKVMHKGIYNLKRGDELITKKIKQPRLKIDWLRKQTAVTCEIHFPPMPEDVDVVDLIEGKDISSYRGMSFFHVKDIKLQHFATPDTEIEEVIEPKEEAVVVENKETTKTNSSLPVEEMSWIVYPNPAESMLYIEQESSQEALVELHNINGQLLWTATMQDQIMGINVSDYPAGSYILKVTNGNKTTAKRVILK